MSKIESPASISNLEEISTASDALMLGWGDLGVLGDIAKLGYYQNKVGEYVKKKRYPLM